MDRDEDEERRLRTVALRNAESILVARQRAEEELVRAKEALELKTQELARSLAMMRATLESTADGILVTDDHGEVTGFNEKFVHMWGMPAEIMSSREHRRILEVASRFFHDAAQFLARVDSIYASSPPESYDLLEPADGRVLERVSRIQFVDARNAGRVWSFRDITARRRAEERERHLQAEAAVANARFQAFFDQGALFAGIMHVDGTIIECNRLALDACGYTKEQVVGKPFWECPWWSPSPTLMQQIKSASTRAAAGETFRAEMSYFVANGSERMVDITLLPIMDEAGRVLFLAPTGTDITERRRLENDLRKLAADLSEANRRKNEFLAMLSHELRSPLAPICNALEIIRAAGGDVEVVDRTSQVMHRQVGHMVRLVDDLLDLSRITVGKIELRSERIELGAVVHHAVESTRALYEGKSHEFTVMVPPEPMYLVGDATRLAQVIGNLLNNACKFTGEGGRIRLTLVRDGDQAVLRVRDSGIGIAGDQLTGIFEMFAQLDTALERSQSGLGVGLTLVKTLVELHNGTIEAHSAGAGLGSEFVVRLPILTVLPQQRPPRDRQGGKADAAVPQRILVVDDNQDSAESLGLLLELAGHEVRLAYDGLEAVHVATTFLPRTILLDIGLPKLNGYEAARRIREQPWGEDMVLVALTGWGQHEDQQKSREAGFNAHMVKPVDYAALTKLLAELPTEKI